MCRVEESGEIKGIHWPIAQVAPDYYDPIIANVDGQIFLLNFTTSGHDGFQYKYWVTVLGTREVAQRYEVKIIAEPGGNTTIAAVMKVHSTDMNKTDILRDPSGTLEITKNMAERMAKENREGRKRFYVNYHIIRK